MEAEKLSNRILFAMAASCNCTTKTPETEYHDPSCRYRVLSEAAARLAELEAEQDALVGAVSPLMRALAESVEHGPDEAHRLLPAFWPGLKHLWEHRELFGADAQRALANVRAEALREARSYCTDCETVCEVNEDFRCLFCGGGRTVNIRSAILALIDTPRGETR